MAANGGNTETTSLNQSCAPDLSPNSTIRSIAGTHRPLATRSPVFGCERADICALTQQSLDLGLDLSPDHHYDHNPQDIALQLKTFDNSPKDVTD